MLPEDRVQACPSPAGFGHHRVNDGARRRVDGSTPHVSTAATGAGPSSSPTSGLHSVLAMLEEACIYPLLDHNEGQLGAAKAQMYNRVKPFANSFNILLWA